MAKVQFDYFWGIEAEQYTFYRIPKQLFAEEYFKSLSCEAKVLYGLLLDRMSLSIKNHWLDEENRVYIIFTVEEIMELINCGSQKAVKLLKELDTENGIGLIEKKRLGLGKPNVIYVKNFMTQKDKEKETEQQSEEIIEEKPALFQNDENHNSGIVKIISQNVSASQSKDNKGVNEQNSLKINTQNALSQFLIVQNHQLIILIIIKLILTRYNLSILILSYLLHLSQLNKMD